MIENANKPAFAMPFSRFYTEGEGWVGNNDEPGLTKREYFAIKAMQGILACSAENTVTEPDRVAIAAIEYADALLEKLENRKT